MTNLTDYLVHNAIIKITPEGVKERGPLCKTGNIVEFSESRGFKHNIYEIVLIGGMYIVYCIITEDIHIIVKVLRLPYNYLYSLHFTR